MSDSCGCPSEAGAVVCDLFTSTVQPMSQHVLICPQCGQTGKAVQGQTIKALLAIRLARRARGRIPLLPNAVLLGSVFRG